MSFLNLQDIVRHPNGLQQQSENIKPEYIRMGYPLIVDIQSQKDIIESCTYPQNTLVSEDTNVIIILRHINALTHKIHSHI